MFMVDDELGELEVELEVPVENPGAALITAGYLVETMEELTEAQIEKLNIKHGESIVELATSLVEAYRNPVSQNKLH